ncbi:MAG: bacteriohemerythrin [Spirochaetaceae bacterium]|jgi:hemerythrin|nr:bacteriohemerythrin [Spirochaetaceae bacterium]
MPDQDFVEWDDRYATGIDLIDGQHKELLGLTNDLFRSCQAGEDSANETFRKIAHATVNYVKYHFSAEERLLEKIDYPQSDEHKKQHASFVKRVLADVKSFEDGKHLVPHNFVRYLRDWILTHIAIYDRQYADFINRQHRMTLKYNAP